MKPLTNNVMSSCMECHQLPGRMESRRKGAARIKGINLPPAKALSLRATLKTVVGRNVIAYNRSRRRGLRNDERVKRSEAASSARTAAGSPERRQGGAL